ncbi:MAG TPA: hypothetical protein DEG17_19585 [Cyanobacteria bacterium UBA11149]|nr:hypothetical protein [Cyanobacteria bacterium UBA11366]HBR76197.1 hypothetical protein [Cyanobacteria bacterium UBA11159]HBS68141.1 hypothetical protein [Cyanobacteria bacterium UBA11153]HBW91003.1 hypothetical protein [Cyanobacteria bacterium UBA11149]HCA95291.1 hypothetical protein [Cyanobacteria bacterium UBA9226]
MPAGMPKRITTFEAIRCSFVWLVQVCPLNWRLEAPRSRQARAVARQRLPPAKYVQPANRGVSLF